MLSAGNILVIFAPKNYYNFGWRYVGIQMHERQRNITFNSIFLRGDTSSDWGDRFLGKYRHPENAPSLWRAHRQGQGIFCG